MRTWFDRTIEWTMIAIAIGSVIEATRILIHINS